MRKYPWLVLIGILVYAGCKQNETAIILPDIKNSFTNQLLRKDSSLSVDSFYLVGIDTMTAKSSLLHQRFPFFHILERLNKQNEAVLNAVDHSVHKPTNDDAERLKTLEDEKKYVNTEIDSLNNLFANADSVKPVGYRAIYKVTVHKMDKFTISDTIAYSLSLKMELSDWDRNIEKDIDSLSVGSHVLRGPFNLTNAMKKMVVR